jgi:penicillin-binding protein 1C
MAPPMRKGARLGQGAVTVVALALGALLALDWACPPPLSRARDLSVVVTDKHGVMLRAFLARDGTWRLPLTASEVDPRFLAMLKAYEDRRFDYHPGVDPLAAARALIQLGRERRVVSGASTLTMQVARLLTPGSTRGPKAKLLQTARALQLERRYGKRDILSLYLTLAPYGGNLEGVRAAALAYFGEEPARLTLAEAALLVALPQSPERQRPDRHVSAARKGRDKVLTRLAERGIVSQRAAQEAMAEPVVALRQALPFSAPHLAERVARGAAPGAVLRATIDGALERALESLAAREAKWFDDTANLAIIVVENKTRAVRAEVANASYWGPFGYLDLTRAVRSPGSTLKPFIYGLAFDDLAAHPETLIEDRPTVFGDYAPRNFDRGYQGTISLRTALALSLNVPAVALLERVGPARFAARLSHAGARLRFPPELGAPALPLALGGVGITLRDLVMLYVALARDGTAAPLVFTQDGAPRAETPLFDEAAAFYVREILRQSPMPDGFSEAQGLKRRPIAFKTGTSFGFRDAWAIGSSRDFTVGVWVGRPDGSARPGRFARNEAAPLLMHVFDLLPQDKGAEPPPPASALLARSYAELPAALQHFVPGAREPLARLGPKLAIAFPPDGAIVSMPGARDEGTLALRAEGGRGQLFWLVDGVPLSFDPAGAGGARIFWRPEGEGFVRISVVDQSGAQASSNVRLVKPR